MTYGIIDNSCSEKSIPIAGLPKKTTSPLAKPNNKEASMAPCGFHFPNIIAAKAINPRPETIPSLYTGVIPMERAAPPIPASAPDIITHRYLIP